MTTRTGWLLLPVALALACSPLAPRPDPSRFYLLTGLPPTEAVADGPPLPDLVLGLGPVSFPPYLRRLEVVNRVSENQVVFSEYDRWAESLEANASRVLASNVAALLGTEQVVYFPWFGPQQPQLAVEVTVRRFEPQPDGMVRLWTRWTLRDTARRSVVDRGDSDLRESVAGTGTPAVVEAMSTVLGRFSRELAIAVRRAYGAGR